ncbi:uncharacterized protein LOC123515646 [Portunus trituberculatus]|uniref:uncharacterized protein LOC123515646 n=1 Tax=Portunus trituberculatus TaxID=210409 RepID=UPI001E1CD2F0|nr:uncharacterized protein LOC123515646 [Portunus trituberculatus]
MIHEILVALFVLLPPILLPAAALNECGGVVDTQQHHTGVITSPGYPDHYPEDATCTWILQAPLHEKIRLEFHDFDVTGSADCHGDYLSISSRPSWTSSRESGDEEETEEKYCGTQGPGVLTSTGDTLVVTFASNAKGSCRGFNASYSVKEEWVTCGSVTQAQEFTFASPSYPASLPAAPVQCSITVDHGCDSPICQIRLDFDEFMLQPPYWGECKYDRFYAESTTPLPFLCGANNGSHMYVNVEGRSKTELTFLLQELEYYLYNCYDIYGSTSDEEAGDQEDKGTKQDPLQESLRKERKNLNMGGSKGRRNVGDYLGFGHDEKPGLRTMRRKVRQAPTTTTTTTAAVTTASVTTPPTASTTTTTTTSTTTEADVTVALYNYKDAEVVSFPTRRAWRIRVTQIPCDCPKARVSKAPVGCLQYYRGLTGELKSFNFDGVGCYSEDRWCDFSTISHASDCDIRVGYTGHYNNLDYSVCVEPESGFCGIQYQQMGQNGFSLTNVTHFRDEDATPLAEVADEGCMSDYLWVPGAKDDQGSDSYERFCGTKLGNARKWGTVTSYSKPFHVRLVTDSDEHSMLADYMNRGFHLTYSQIPCKLSG